MTPACTTWCIK